MSKKLEQRTEWWPDSVEETEVEPEVEPEVELVEAVQTLIGKVVDCPKLNVRKDPYTDSPILCVIKRNEEVEVDPSESTANFYKIYLANGVEGFCMKQFIETE